MDETGKNDYLSPLSAVKEYFELLNSLSGHEGKRVKDVCESGERLIKCLDHQMRQKNRATETAQELICTFRLGVRKLVHLKGEVEDLKKTMKELQLAEQGLDSRSIGPLPSASVKTAPILHKKQKDFSTSSSGPIPRALSYEDFLKHKDLTLSNTLSSRKSESSAGGSFIRKAKSESDVAVSSLKKKVDALTVDIDRLKESEKSLVKKNIKLNRNVKALEKERDMAEDRLKIEQTQRDSIEKLRQRNKELEDQLRRLCESQVIREREATKGSDESASTRGDTNATEQ